MDRLPEGICIQEMELQMLRMEVESYQSGGSGILGSNIWQILMDVKDTEIKELKEKYNDLARRQHFLQSDLGIIRSSSSSSKLTAKSTIGTVPHHRETQGRISNVGTDEKTLQYDIEALKTTPPTNRLKDETRLIVPTSPVNKPLMQAQFLKLEDSISQKGLEISKLKPVHFHFGTETSVGIARPNNLERQLQDLTVPKDTFIEHPEDVDLPFSEDMMQSFTGTANQIVLLQSQIKALTLDKDRLQNDLYASTTHHLQELHSMTTIPDPTSSNFQYPTMTAALEQCGLHVRASRAVLYRQRHCPSTYIPGESAMLASSAVYTHEPLPVIDAAAALKNGGLFLPEFKNQYGISASEAWEQRECWRIMDICQKRATVHWLLDERKRDTHGEVVVAFGSASEEVMGRVGELLGKIPVRSEGIDRLGARTFENKCGRDQRFQKLFRKWSFLWRLCLFLFDEDSGIQWEPEEQEFWGHEPWDLIIAAEMSNRG